jgi:3-hydroxyisobutyrate dehydrogenase-like beta-hydroxyacid dehydrogenase
MSRSEIHIAVLGLGEAGSEIAGDLVAAGARVRGYDPVVTTPPGGVLAVRSEADAVAGCELVISLTTAEQAVAALTAASPALAGRDVVWADLNTSGPELKRHLDRVVSAAGSRFADVAIMSPVPGRGLRSPMVASGRGAADAAAILDPFGARVQVLDAPAGVAATRKLLRSIFFKGMAAAVVEALRTAEHYDLDEWLRDHIGTELDLADRAFARRLEEGSYRHAARRAEEMAAAADLVERAGLRPRVSAAARDWMRELAVPRPAAGTSGS